MKVFTADEVGLIKNVSFECTPSTITAHGKVDRNRNIHLITTHNSTITVARGDGSVEVCGSNGTILQTYTVPLNTETKQKFIGVYHYMHYIVCVLNSGSVGYLIDTTVEKSVQEFEFDSEKLFVAKGCGSLLATGGEERELQVWDLNALITSNTMNCLFKAKNVKNCELDLRQKVWIRDLQFITPEKIAIVTEYKHLRVYNTTESRRPFVNIAVGESPLRSIVSTDTFGIVGDNCGHLVKVCYTDKKPIGTFQGSAGSIVQLAMHRNRLFCVGMDRFLRVFDIQSREEIEKVYLKQRMTGIALMREDEDDQEEQEEASVEELWNDMEDVDKSESE